MDIFDALTVSFVVLKLLHIINWPWIWVVSPFLIKIGLILVILIIIGVIKFLDWWFNR
jgi:hypothetical protein